MRVSGVGLDFPGSYGGGLQGGAELRAPMHRRQSPGASELSRSRGDVSGAGTVLYTL